MEKSLNPKKNVKLLGVCIDNKLNFDIHIRNLCNSANKKLNCFYRIKKYLSIKQRHVLANAYVLSPFNYCPLIWMFCSKGLANCMDRVHRRCLRAIYGFPNISTSELLASLDITSIHTQNLRYLLVEIFKSLNGLNPIFMKDFYVKKFLPYEMRNSNLLTLPPANTTKYGTNSVHFRGCLLWNNLPQNLKEAPNVNIFKEHLKRTSIVCTCANCTG